MRPRAKSSGRGQRNARSGLALILPLAVLVTGIAACGTSSSSGSDSSPAAGSSTTASASGKYEPLSWFQARLAQDYSPAVVGTPPSSAPAHKPGLNVWTISCGQESAGCSGPAAATVAAGRLLGWNVKVCDGDFGIGGAIGNCIQQAIAAKAAAVISISLSCNQAHAAMLELKAKHIPLIGSDAFDCNDPDGYVGSQSVFTDSIEFTKAAPTAADLNEAIGSADADYLVAHYNGQVKVIDLAFQVPGAEYANTGFLAELAKCQTCQVVDTIKYSPADTADGNLKNEFASALAAYPTANSVFDWSDAIADQNGYVASIDSVGKQSSFCLVTAQDSAGPVNDQYMNDGNGQCADGGQDSEWLGYSAIDEVLRAVNGQPAALEGEGPLLISKGHNIPAGNGAWHYDYNYIAAYKSAWGVG
jgi:ribose transport system substrate-binding protein